MSFRFKRPMILVAALVVMIGGLYWWAFLRRESSEWVESVPLTNSVTATIHVQHSAQPYWSFGHAGGIGGGDDRYWIDADVEGRRYTWQGGDEAPICFGLKDGRLYMAVFDRSDMSRVRFRYYRSDADNRLTEIQPADFPKELAVQNAWLDDGDAALLADMNPGDYWFRHSLTARMWLHLVNGVEYYQGEDPSEGFVADFKAKHLGPVSKAGASQAQEVPQTSTQASSRPLSPPAPASGGDQSR